MCFGGSIFKPLCWNWCGHSRWSAVKHEMKKAFCRIARGIDKWLWPHHGRAHVGATRIHRKAIPGVRACITFPVPLVWTFWAKLCTHKSEEGFYRFCSKRQKFCSFARHTLTIIATPIPSIAMHISSLLDPFQVHFKFISTPKYYYSQKFPKVPLEWVQQWRYMHPHHHHRLNTFLMNISRIQLQRLRFVTAPLRKIMRGWS